MDWPGRLSVVVFMSGCNLRCPWCQNPDCVLGRGRAEKGEVLRTIERSVPVIDSVVLTGGEPTLHPEECAEILEFAERMGLKRALETNGTRPEVLEELLPRLDFVAVDVKAPLSDAALYSRVAGGVPVSTERIAESLRIAVRAGVELEPRTTVVPGLNSDPAVVRRIAGELREIGVGRLRLTQFRNERTLDPEFQRIRPPGREDLLRLAGAAAEEGLEVCIFTSERGLERIRKG